MAPAALHCTSSSSSAAAAAARHATHLSTSASLMRYKDWSPGILARGVKGWGRVRGTTPGAADARARSAVIPRARDAHLFARHPRSVPRLLDTILTPSRGLRHCRCVPCCVRPPFAHTAS
jgi:hypothetical protein